MIKKMMSRTLRTLTVLLVGMLAFVPEAQAWDSSDIGCDYMGTGEFVLWHFAALLAAFIIPYFLALPGGPLATGLLAVGRATGGVTGAAIGGGTVAFIINCGISGWAYFTAMAFGIVFLSMYPVARRIVKQNKGTEKVNLVRLAAEQGDKKALACLALYYERGEGVPQDYVEAEKFYHLAAEQEEVKSQYILGTMYLYGKWADGKSFDKDPTVAAKWYGRAAENGDASAQFMLGVMYHTGRGVGKDPHESKRLLTLAANQGHEGAIAFAAKVEAEDEDVS